MKGVIFESAGAAPKVVDDLPVPEPAEDQILVKSLYAAINPVDAYIANTGLLLVDGFPIGLGVDGSGIVVKPDSKHKKFAVGDHVCGCARLGSRGYNTVAEFFLMDAAVAIPRPKNISVPQAATVGVGAETACLALFDGLGIELPSTTTTTTGSSGAVDSSPKAKEPSKGKDKEDEDEWLVVLGGASSVGKFAVQIAAACGFKVAASCSAASADVVRDLDASAVFDYKAPLDEQVKTVVTATANGKLARVFDAVGSNVEFARALFKELDSKDADQREAKDADAETDQREAKGDTNTQTQPQAQEHKYRFATTNDFTAIDPMPHTTAYQVRFGPVGRPDEPELNAKIASYIPVIVALMEQDKVAPSAYDVVGEGGFQDAIEAYTYQARGAGGANKVLVKIQDE